MQKKIMVYLIFLVISSTARDFVSQEFVDTTIQRAYFGFIAASKKAGGAYTQESAIKNAKDVLNQLSTLAENDPNHRYILWKISELQQQISLEEEEVFLKQKYAKINEINNLVEIFNKELFKKRASFANLHTLHARMLTIDIRKANELAENINQKNRQIIAQLRNAMANNFKSGNYTAAQQEYDYAITNRKYLNLKNNDYQLWGNKIQAKREADYLRRNIQKRMMHIQQIVAQNKLSEATRHIAVMKNDLIIAKPHLTKSFIAQNQQSLKRLTTKIMHQEDSLVTYTLSLIKGENTKMATRHLNEVLIPAGVGRVKCATIDRAILAASETVQRDNREVHSQISAVTQSSTHISMDKIKARMQEKADSIKLASAQEEVRVKAYFEKRNRSEIKKWKSAFNRKAKHQKKVDLYLENVTALFDEGKNKAAVKKFSKKEKKLFAYATPIAYVRVKKMINLEKGIANYNDDELKEMIKRHNTGLHEKLENKSISLTGEIYTLLEEKRIEEAFQRYYYNEILLAKHCYADAFITLKKTVVRAYRKDKKI